MCSTARRRTSLNYLADFALLLNLNRGGKRAVPFKCDPAPWLDGHATGYTVKQYDSMGTLTKTLQLESGTWNGGVSTMEPLDIALFEITPRQR